MIDYKKISKDPDYDQTYYPFFYKGFRAEQNPNIFKALDELAKEELPRQIIEIGFRRGGFTKILDDHPVSENALIFAYDISPQAHGEFSPKVSLIEADCFGRNDEIEEIIKREGRTFVFCDGGDKIREIEIFARYLKPGDMIFGHDYAPSRDIWEKDYLGKKWDWMECWDDAVKETIAQYNLEPHLTMVFNNAMWLSLRK